MKLLVTRHPTHGTRADTHGHTYIRTHLHTHKHASTHTDTRASTDVHTRTRIYTYGHTYVRTHVHTDTEEYRVHSTVVNGRGGGVNREPHPVSSGPTFDILEPQDRNPCRTTWHQKQGVHEVTSSGTGWKQRRRSPS